MMYFGTDFFGFIPVFTHLLKYRGLCFCLFVFAGFVRFSAIISLSPFLGLSSFSFSSRT